MFPGTRHLFIEHLDVSGKQLEAVDTSQANRILTFIPGTILWEEDAIQGAWGQGDRPRLLLKCFEAHWQNIKTFFPMSVVRSDYTL